MGKKKKSIAKKHLVPTAKSHVPELDIPGPDNIPLPKVKQRKPSFPETKRK